jgi:hypothetical protein
LCCTIYTWRYFAIDANRTAVTIVIIRINYIWLSRLGKRAAYQGAGCKPNGTGCQCVAPVIIAPMMMPTIGIS